MQKIKPAKVNERDPLKVSKAMMQKGRLEEQAKIRRQLQQLSGLKPEQIARELDRRCHFCGELETPRVEEYEILGTKRNVIIWPDFHDCAKAQKAKANAPILDAMHQAKIAEELHRHKLTDAGLNGWLATATFDNYKPRQEWAGAADALERVKLYQDNYQKMGANWLILYGGYGLGKTHLAAALVHEAIDNGAQAYLRVWTDYLKRLTATYDKRYEGQETEADIIAELQKGDLVVIDDLDKRDSDFTRSTLYVVLNYRYNAGLPTVLTFNHSPDEVTSYNSERLILQDFLGSAVLDRIMGRSYDVIEFAGPSFRSGVELRD